MLSDAIRALILEEQARQDGRFIEGVELQQYLAKLHDKSEILSDTAQGRCRGFVAFYCNDESSRQAYITLLLIDPRERGTGLGSTLANAVLDIARRRGFRTCRLEVAKSNEPSRAMFLKMGFRIVEERGGKDLFEIAL